MRAIGVVGYHNSGKTTLASALARELRCGFMSVHHSCVTRTLIQRCGQDRMQVAAWVVNTPELRDHLLAQEVVAIGEI